MSIINFYWNKAMLIYFRIVYDSLNTTMTVFNRVVVTKTRWPSKPEIFMMWSFTKQLWKPLI